MSHIVCPSCHTTNRIAEDKLTNAPNCGKCKNKLFLGKPSDLTIQNFTKHINNSSIPIVVDFWAPWCGPCQSMAPTYNQIASTMEPSVRFAKVNTEDQQQLASQYQIRSIPTLMIFKNGKIVAQQAGAMNSDMLTQWIKQHQ